MAWIERRFGHVEGFLVDERPRGVSGFDIAAARAAPAAGLGAGAPRPNEHRGVESTHVPPDADQRFTFGVELPAPGAQRGAAEGELALPV